MSTDQELLEEAQTLKLLEVQNQQAKLSALQAELEKLNNKINQHETLSPDDTKFISNVGWLSVLSVSIATMVASL